MKNEKKIWFRVFGKLSRMGLLKWVPDNLFLKVRYRGEMNKPLNLRNPQTFNEKLQWLKLYDRNPEYTCMVDKCEAKKYVVSKLGEEYIIPTLGAWNRFEEIDLDKLPNQFVLKCTHDSGGIVICKDKTEFNKEEARRIIHRSLACDFFRIAREWPYKGVPHRIIAEEYIEALGDNDLLDYKMYSFHGNPKLTIVCSNRFGSGGTRMDFYDVNWQYMDVIMGHYMPTKQPFKKPEHYDEMLSICRTLSKDFPFLRVDFYDVEGHLYVGELTFYPGAGFETLRPIEFDYEMGGWLHLEDKHRS